MGVVFRRFLDEEHDKIVSCRKCRTHLTTVNKVISKLFQGQRGRAYLYSHVVNVVEGEHVSRNMTTGIHTVCDIFCNVCNEPLGWKYIKAMEPTQVYKEGKFILEKAAICTGADLLSNHHHHHHHHHHSRLHQQPSSAISDANQVIGTSDDSQSVSTSSDESSENNNPSSAPPAAVGTSSRYGNFLVAIRPRMNVVSPSVAASGGGSDSRSTRLV